HAPRAAGVRRDALAREVRPQVSACGRIFPDARDAKQVRSRAPTARKEISARTAKCSLSLREGEMGQATRRCAAQTQDKAAPEMLPKARRRDFVARQNPENCGATSSELAPLLETRQRRRWPEPDAQVPLREESRPPAQGTATEQEARRHQTASETGCVRPDPWQNVQCPTAKTPQQ